jgi:hypothetical protein
MFVLGEVLWGEHTVCVAHTTSSSMMEHENELREGTGSPDVYVVSIRYYLRRSSFWRSGRVKSAMLEGEQSRSVGRGSGNGAASAGG